MKLSELKEKIRSAIREQFIDEMSQNDVHFKEIMKFYDKGSSNAKKALSLYLLRKPHATRNQIMDELGDYGYNDVWDVMDHFKLKIESVNQITLNEGLGDSIKKIKNTMKVTYSSNLQNRFEHRQHRHRSE